MATRHVLRVRRTDGASAHLLVNVTQTSKTRPLDLKIVATDHEHLYHGSVKSSNLVALQASKYTGDDDEWKQVLACALLQERPDANLDALQSLEVVAAVDGETCTLTLRNNIGGITTRLGAIKLTQDDEREEVSAFEWVDTAVAASDELRSELATLHVSLESQQAQVAKLTTQLDELVKAKKEHEEQLLRKCAVLLDSKRAKIREQQRELNSVSKAHGRKAGASSRGKRKANDPSPDVDLDNDAALDSDAVDDDADDDQLDIEEEEGQRTPEQETEDEGSDDGFASAPPKGPTRKASSKNQNHGRDGGNVNKDGLAMDVDVDDLPPRRELPFARKRAQGGGEQEKQDKKPLAPAPVPEEDESDDDDEL